MNNMNFIIPDFLNTDECTYILNLIKEHKEVFKDNVSIIGLTGMFPGCVWNKKDKKFNMYKLDISLIRGLKEKYSNLNISLIIIFDKEEVSSSDLNDEYSNEVIKIFNNKKNFVLCKSKKLRDYIKEHYKEIKVIDYYENSDEDSEFIIINPKDNKNKDILKSKDKNKYILMPDLGFIPNRRNLFKHSKKDSVLNPINPKKDRYFSKEDNLSFTEVRKDDNHLSYTDLIEYSKDGIDKFILSGIGVYNIAMYENIISYLYKEEYQMDARINQYNRLMVIKEQEENAIYNYRM